MENKSKYVQHIIGANIPVTNEEDKRSDEFIGFRAWQKEPRDTLTYLRQLHSEK